MRTPGPRGLGMPTMRDAAVRLLRQHGFLVDEDLLSVEREGVTEKQLLPAPALTYRRRRTSGGRGDGESGEAED